jgi:hypothetical protein
MSVKKLFETQSVWEAAVLVYLYGSECLAIIRDEETESRKRVTTYSIAVPSEDVKIVLEDYLDGRLVLSDAQSFVGAFNSITQRQNAMRRRGESQYCSPEWINGKIG